MVSNIVFLTLALTATAAAVSGQAGGAWGGPAGGWGAPAGGGWGGGAANPWIPPWIASAPWMPRWVACDNLTAPGPSCSGCTTRLICTKVGGMIRECTDPTLPYCDLGQCVATPNAACAPAAAVPVGVVETVPVGVVETVPAAAAAATV